jgi:hypothetical protein
MPTREQMREVVERIGREGTEAFSRISWEGFSDAQVRDIQHRVLAGESPDFWMDGVRPDAARAKKKDDLFASDDPVGVYQVWHRAGKEFHHVADVTSNYMGAIVMTSVGREHPLARNVTWLVDQARPTTYGDKIVDPLGKAYELHKQEVGPVLRETEMPGHYNPQPRPVNDKRKDGLTR